MAIHSKSRAMPGENTERKPSLSPPAPTAGAVSATPGLYTCPGGQCQGYPLQETVAGLRNIS